MPDEAPGGRLILRREAAAAAAVLSVALLVAAVPLCAAGRAPFAEWFYPICWYALIVACDAFQVLAGGKSTILNRGRPWGLSSFLVLVFWSAAVWFFFEAANTRLANWYYIFVSDELWVQIASSFISFGTVLPALFLIEALLERGGLFKKATWGSFRLGLRGRAALAAAGGLCLLLPMLWPKVFYPLIWLGLTFLLEPWNRGRIGSSLLFELEEGRPGRLLRILAAGLICGIIWEFLNSFARIRWIYTVPFMGHFKLFEMPPLGFLGFPPFAVECVAVYGSLVSLGLAPATGNIQRRPEVKPLPRPAAAAAFVAAAAGMWLSLQGMLVYNVDSFTPRPDQLDLPARVQELARDAATGDLFGLASVLQHPVVPEVLSREGVDLEKTGGLVRLALFRGIGCVHANALSKVGVARPEDLASRDPAQLAAVLSRVEGGSRPISPARVAVWVRASRRMFGSGE